MVEFLRARARIATKLERTIVAYLRQVFHNCEINIKVVVRSFKEEDDEKPR